MGSSGFFFAPFHVVKLGRRSIFFLSCFPTATRRQTHRGVMSVEAASVLGDSGLWKGGGVKDLGGLDDGDGGGGDGGEDDDDQQGMAMD